jgi:peptidyl-dipeptidase Dcp
MNIFTSFTQKYQFMKTNVLIFVISIIMATGCTTSERDQNPLLTDYGTPFNVPPFDKIKPEHFMPAFEKAFTEQQAEIDDIVNNSEAPTFENTIEAYEFSGQLLIQVNRVFVNANSSNTNDEIQSIAREVSPKKSQHDDNILLNPDLFQRIRTVYDQRDALDLNPEQLRLLEETHKRFIRGGAALAPEKQDRLREINQQLASLTLQFGQNILGEINAFRLVVDKEEDLSGLPQSVVDVAAEKASAQGLEGQWVFTLHNPSVMPFLQNADNRDLRKVMQQAYINRGNNDNEFDNKEIIGQIVNLRLEKAQLLGYDNHASYVLEENMAKDVETVQGFLNQLWEAVLAISKMEAYDLQAMMDAEGHDFRLEQWDWRYYAEKVRKEKYDIDEEEIRQYFELNTVREGVFDVVGKLWGLQFKLRDDIPVYHPDAQAYEVLEADGKHVGILYMDFHPRESKRGGAWMNSYRIQHVDRNGAYIHPVITIVCNFSPPVGGQPALLTYDEMTTFFHEFGHALHGLMSDVTYQSLAGTQVSRDFVELPSQVMENWAKEPEIMMTFAKHHKTGEPMPQELMDKIKASGYFNQGFDNVEFIASALLDMEYHTITQPFRDDELKQVASIVDERTIQNSGLILEIHFRHGSTHFNHIFSGGYSAGYYSYIWSGMLDTDVYEAFRETGDFFDQETAISFRKNILERGNTKDAMEMFVNFRGREPVIEPLLRQRGILK